MATLACCQRTIELLVATLACCQGTIELIVANLACCHGTIELIVVSLDCCQGATEPMVTTLANLQGTTELILAFWLDHSKKLKLYVGVAGLYAGQDIPPNWTSQICTDLHMITLYQTTTYMPYMAVTGVGEETLYMMDVPLTYNNGHYDLL